MIARPRGMRLPDTAHLTAEDAALFEQLYLERNTVSRGELQRVRCDQQAAHESEPRRAA